MKVIWRKPFLFFHYNHIIKAEIMDMNLPVPKDGRYFECVDIIDRISKLPDEILELIGVDMYLLNAISQVECLILTTNDMSLQDIIDDPAIPIFKNLKTLKLLVQWPAPPDWKVLPNLLNSSPNLQVLIFPEGLVTLTFDNDDFHHFNWQRPESVPGSLSMHLKTIEIFEFVGFPEELDVVEYFLECGEVLEKMIIHRFVLSKHPAMRPTMEEKVKQDKVMSEVLSMRRKCSTGEVMSFKRSSSSCEVIFTD
ncbi:F-box/LRR-repeat protein At4g14096-like isoform X2 [Euphorbia lathyris]|uniref:F-box/LRR-repeat protein At4g14096-like isoform X2 n=1 Tax=Euphorbia lathyris TaxID=212925 RepID=UPI0033138031